MRKGHEKLPFKREFQNRNFRFQRCYSLAQSRQLKEQTAPGEGRDFTRALSVIAKGKKKKKRKKIQFLHKTQKNEITISQLAFIQKKIVI